MSAPALTLLQPQKKTAVARPPRVCETIVSNMPTSLRGVYRLRYLSEQVQKLSDKARMSLQRYVEQFMRFMVEINASDLDLGGPSAGGSLWYRVEGTKQPHLNLGDIDHDTVDLLILNLLSDDQQEMLLSDCSIDFSYQIKEVEDQQVRRFRATAYLDIDNLALNMRSIMRDVRPLKSLGFHPKVEEGFLFRNVRDGLTLVTGVTGTGKSTTLDAIVDANNQDAHAHIVIIGNPIEYVHDSDKCLIRHRELGRSVNSFKDGIVQAVRQDPDMIVIGEMRDPETITAAMEVSDSGHRVFSTLHTASAVDSIKRIIAEYPAEEQDRIRQRLGEMLRIIVSQKLVPRQGGGRILAKEVFWVTPPARAAIKNGNLDEIYQMIWESNQTGQITLEQDLFRLLHQGQITKDTAIRFANNRARMGQLLGR